MACNTIQQQPEPAVIPSEEPTVEPTIPSTPVPVEVEKTQLKATKTIVIVEQPPIVLEENECSELGCPLGTTLIGDAKTDLYYECKCTFVKWIKPVHLLCFDSEEEAMERGYRKAESC
jgi:hypothetical protein